MDWLAVFSTVWDKEVYLCLSTVLWLQYSSKLKERAHLSSLDEEELKAIGMSMEEYAFHLIEPLKNDIIKRAIFEGKEFDRVAEKAVLLKQKKVHKDNTRIFSRIFFCLT